MLAHIVALLVLGLACAVHCRQLHEARAQIPPRCRQASVTPVSCAQHTPGNLVPHPDDCELFYYCVTPHARPVCRQCPARLHFNPRLHVCDRPEAAGCQEPARPTTATEAPVTETSASDGNATDYSTEPASTDVHTA